MSIPVSGAFLIELGAAVVDGAGAFVGVEERRTELINKGYTEGQAELMIHFELGYTLTASNLTGVVTAARFGYTGPYWAPIIGLATSSMTYPFYR